MLKNILLLFLAIFLSACTLGAVPTETAPTAGEVATATEFPTPAPEEPTATISEAGPALEAIVILQPGLNSFIVSPVTVEGQSRPTFEQNLVVAIYGEDALLSQQPTTLDSPAGESGNFSIEVPFEVNSEQPGRISVYETSAMDGGIVHLSSVEVTLASGAAVEAPPLLGIESIDIQSPAPLAEISGGVISVNGYSDYYFESNLGLLLCGGGGTGAPDDLCGTTDNILASGNAMIAAADVGQPGRFSGELTYSISEPTPARIVVFAASPRDGGWLHVNSIPILLSP